MELLDAIRKRHSVRQYKETPIEQEIIDELEREIKLINKEGDLNFQLVLNEPEAFSGRMAHYGSFSGVRNYFALVGKKCPELYEKCGYYGERLVLKAQMLGLHTCWVALTYKRLPNAFKVEKGEKFTVVIAVGHGKNRGVVRSTKTAQQVSNLSESTPDWFARGVDAALLAPTAMNQQRFYLTYNPDGTVSARAGMGFYAKMDLGIVKYNFLVGAGKENFSWR